MMAIPTSLELPHSDVRLLRDFAARALRGSPAFVALLQSLDGTATPPARSLPSVAP
jgi:hypothetical protein